MTNPVGRLDSKNAYRHFLATLVTLPPADGRRQLQVLKEACQYAKQHAGKTPPDIPNALPFAEDGWDDGLALCEALEKTIF